MPTIWMGDLDPYMDETFISNAFAAAGETVTNVRLIRQRGGSNMSAGYCFVDVPDAEAVLAKLPNIPIPGSNPVKRFKLNHASHSGAPQAFGGPEFSIFVGDLSMDVTDQDLQKFFRTRYSSVRAAKVVLDQSGLSKGYGFVRFSDPDEHQRAMTEMQGVRGCGSKSLRVSAATPRRDRSGASNEPPGSRTQSAATTTASAQVTYDPVATYLSAMQQQQQQQQFPQPYTASPAYSQQWPGMYPGQPGAYAYPQMAYPGAYDESAMAAAAEPCEDPNPPLRVDELNAAVFKADNALFDDMECSLWQPVDSVSTEVPQLLLA